jgi:ribulose-5-phosphate 4-epimerase/fuculose-1-phosphate aldolase
MKKPTAKPLDFNLDIINKSKRKVTPKQAVKLLKEHGTIVTKAEAEQIIDWMYKFGKLAVDTYIKI